MSDETRSKGVTDRELAGCERIASLIHNGFGPIVLRGLNPRVCQGSTALKNHVALTQGAQRSAGIARMHAATGNREKQVQFALLGDA
jgi:hypothetical protein